MLVVSQANLLIEHSDVFERLREHGHTPHGSFRSRYNEGPLRLFTRQRALTLAPTSRQPSLPPPPSPPSARAPLSTPSTSATLSMVFQPYYPTPRDQCSWKGGRAFALAPSAYAVPSLLPYFLLSHSLSLPLSLSPSRFFWPLSVFLNGSLHLSHAVAPIRAAGAKMPETRLGTWNAAPWPDWTTTAVTSVHPASVSVDRDVS